MTINKLFLTLLSIALITLFICINKEVDAQDVAVKIGVVLDKESMEGKIGLSSMKMAISDFYAAHPYFKTRIVLHVRHSKRHDVLMAAAAALDLVKNERVAAIIGPQTSSEAQFVTNLGKKAHVPIVSYSVTSPSVSPSKNKYFIRATQNDSSQVQPITALIQSFEWRELVLVCLDDDDDQCGGGFMPVLANDLQKIGTRVSDRSVMPSSASDDQIEAELYRLKSMPTRVFVVHVMEISIGSRIFLAANRLGMMGEEYVWIVTSAMGNVLESLDRRVLQSMQGVLGVQSFVPRTREMENFVVRWNVKFRQEYPNLSNFGMSIVGLRAYDAAISIARAVKEVGVTNFTFQSSDNAIDFGCSEGKVTDSPNTSCSSIGVSQFGQQLLQAIHQTRFKGLGGNFILVNGQLQSSTFRLINVWGNRVNEVGFWNESSGLILDNLKPIIWPEGLKLAPKGWVVSPNGKKLKIGVPVKNGFVQFVKVDQNHNTGKPKVTGYCIDVFDAVMKKLPYFVSYEYIPFTERVGEPTNSYNTLVDQVYLKKFDSVVGDITIRANRTSFVDFTFPYTESGVVMIVPLKNNKEIRAWLFIKPLTWDLWVVAFCSFIFIAFVVWVLEHRINEDFRGPPGHQAGTSLYYSFSTLVFSHSFNVFNNLTRFVVIIWVFVVLILIQSYTANLASLLTVEQLQPTVTNVDELIRRGETIGFQEGSFVENSLINMKFRPSKLKSYNTTLQLHELLAKGTQNGGIAAAFDELPYVKIFLAEYGSKYTMVPPTYKTDGFGFVFPKGSPLGLDVSREVLTVMESEEMTEIENKWFKQSNRPDLGDSLSSTSLGLDSFWGLFTIAGVSALVALIIYSVGFLKEHKSVLYDDDASIWTRFMTLMSIYDQKNLNSHTFKKGQPQDQSVIDTSTNTPYPQSPSNFWNDSDRELNCYEQSTPSSEKFCSDSSRMERVDVLTTPV